MAMSHPTHGPKEQIPCTKLSVFEPTMNSSKNLRCEASSSKQKK